MNVRVNARNPRVTRALRAAETGNRLSKEDGAALFDADILELGPAADSVRRRFHPEEIVTFCIDRNITFTNICSSGCKFCAFWASADSSGGFLLSIDEVLARVRELVELGGTQVMLQGGLNPALDLKFYCRLLSEIKKNFKVHLHSLSPAEVDFLAKKENLSVKEVLIALKNAGLDSLPGAAEILVDRVRQLVSPHKLDTARWLEIMASAHALGMHTTATMTFGMMETKEERIEHLMRIRELQDETLLTNGGQAGGFKAFIPWTFSPAKTGFSHLPMAGGIDYLKTLAISRLFLDNVPNIHAGWVTEGFKLAQVGLAFGANDMGGILMEEVVVKSTGIENHATVSKLIQVIKSAGKTPAQRNSKYEILRIFN